MSAHSRHRTKIYPITALPPCRTLSGGVLDYGLVVNPQKVVVNFQVSEDSGASPNVRMLPASCLFPWCGLLLDTHTLDVFQDYSR